VVQQGSQYRPIILAMDTEQLASVRKVGQGLSCRYQDMQQVQIAGQGLQMFCCHAPGFSQTPCLTKCRY
jgi:hypothetical protein